MPESLTELTLNRHWGPIETAVTAGLDGNLDHELAKLLPVTTILDDELQFDVHPYDVPIVDDGEPRGTLTHFAVTTQTVDVDVRLPLSAKEVSEPPLGRISDWAAFARRVERDVVLTLIRRACLGDANPAALPPLSAARVKDEAKSLAKAFGELRLIVLENTTATRKVSEDLSKDKAWDGEIFAPADDLPRSAADAATTGDVVAILLRAGSGPQVKRAGDLSLSWLPVDHGGVELTLTGRMTILRRTEARLFRRSAARPAVAAPVP